MPSRMISTLSVGGTVPSVSVATLVPATPTGENWPLHSSPGASTRVVSRASTGLRASTGRSITVFDFWLPDSASTVSRPMPMRGFTRMAKAVSCSPGRSNLSVCVAGPTSSKALGSACRVSFTSFTCGSKAKAVTGMRASSSGPTRRGAVASTDSGSRTVTVFSVDP